MGILNFFRKKKNESDSTEYNESKNNKSDIESIISKFRIADIGRDLHLKEEEALPLLELLHQLNDQELKVLKRKVVKWKIHSRQTFLNVIGFEKSTPEERFKYFEKEMFPGYWHSRTNNKVIKELYQYIFRYSLCVFNPTPIHHSDLVSELLNHLSDKDWEALKIDLPFWSSYQNTFFIRLLNNHPISSKYSALECFKAVFPDNWQSLTTNFAVASAYRVIVEHERYDSDYWLGGHGTIELLNVLSNLFEEKDWEELEEDFKYWSAFQLECFMEAFFAETYVNTQEYSWDEKYISAAIKLYHMMVPILKICNERQPSYSNIPGVVIENIEFIDVHFNTFTKEDFSTVKTTEEILKLIGFENEKSGLVGEIWERVDILKE